MVDCLLASLTSHMPVCLRHGSDRMILRAATLRKKLQIKLTVLPSHRILTPHQLNLTLNLYLQTPGRVATRVPILRAATLRKKLQIKLAVLPSHRILTPHQLNPALTLHLQLATGVPTLKSLVRLHRERQESIPGTPNRLVGLVVKASASGAEDPEFESRLRQDFFFRVESYQ